MSFDIRDDEYYADKSDKEILTDFAFFYEYCEWTYELEGIQRKECESLRDIFEQKKADPDCSDKEAYDAYEKSRIMRNLYDGWRWHRDIMDTAYFFERRAYENRHPEVFDFLKLVSDEQTEKDPASKVINEKWYLSDTAYEAAEIWKLEEDLGFWIRQIAWAQKMHDISAREYLKLRAEYNEKMDNHCSQDEVRAVRREINRVLAEMHKWDSHLEKMHAIKKRETKAYNQKRFA